MNQRVRQERRVHKQCNQRRAANRVCACECMHAHVGVCAVRWYNMRVMTLGKEMGEEGGPVRRNSR